MANNFGIIPLESLPQTSPSQNDYLIGVSGNGGKSFRFPSAEMPTGSDAELKINAVRNDLNATKNELNETIIATSSQLQSQIDSLEVGQQTQAIYAETLNDLQAVVGTYVGQGAFVTNGAGAGQYRWDGSAWQFLRADSLSQKADKAVVDPMVPVVDRLNALAQVGNWPGVIAGIVDEVGNQTWLQANDTDGKLTAFAELCVRVAIGVVNVSVAGLGAAVTMRDAEGNERLTDLRVRETDGRFPEQVIQSIAQRVSPYLDLPDGDGLGLLWPDVRPTSVPAFVPSDTYVRGREVLPIFPDMTRIVGWGSSTINQLSSYFIEMAQGFGVSYTNRGQGGEFSTQTLARMGSVPALLSFPGGFIPAAAGEHAVTCSNVLPIAQMLAFTGWVNGVKGRLSVISGAFSFRRDVAGDAVEVQSDTPFIPELGPTNRAQVTILNLGKNDFQNGTEQQSDADLIYDRTSIAFDWLAPLVKRVIVMGHFCNPSWSVTSRAQIQVIKYNRMIAARYGKQFFDLGGYVASPEIWTDTGVTPTAQDIAAQGRGQMPPSLTTDGIHLNSVAYVAVTARMTDLIRSLNWFN